MQNNPNIVDSLFTPEHVVTYQDEIGKLVRANANLFLHKGLYHKYKGYAHSQISKMRNKDRTGKRKASIDKFGYDVKFAYHLVRLVLQAELALTEHTMDLTRNKEILKPIRRGEWPEQKVYDWFDDKEKVLDQLYVSSTLRNTPDEAAIKSLLINCIEQYHGSIANFTDGDDRFMQEVITLVEKYKDV